MCESYGDFDAEIELDEEPIENRNIAYRRQKRILKDLKRRRIIGYYGYAPHIGFICDTYIKYSSHSNCQRWMKRQTSKRARKADLPNGNSYRKVFDYWWTLY